jgi:hypothetical protein
MVAFWNFLYNAAIALVFVGAVLAFVIDLHKSRQVRATIKSRLCHYAGKLIEGAVLGGSLLVPLVFSTKTPSNFALPKSTVLRLAASAVAIGLVVKRQKIGRGVLPCLASWIVSAWKSPYSRTAFQGNYLRMSGVIEAVNLFVLYLGSKMVPARKILSALMLSGAIVTLFSLIQKIGWDGHKWGRDVKVRPGSTLGNPIFMGGFLAMLLPPTLLRFIEARYWEQKAGYLLLAGAYTWGIIVSKSRSAYLGAAAGVAVFATNLATKRRELVRSNRWWLAQMIIAIVPFTRQIGAFIGSLHFRSNRLNIWHDAIRAWKERPLFGWGNDCARPAINLHKSVATAKGEPETSFDRVHNHYLDELVMRGACGLLTFLRLAWLGFSRQWRSGQSDLAGMSAAFLAGNLTAFPTATTWMAWWMAQGMNE